MQPTDLDVDYFFHNRLHLHPTQTLTAGFCIGTSFLAMTRVPGILMSMRQVVPGNFLTESLCSREISFWACQWVVYTFFLLVYLRMSCQMIWIDILRSVAWSCIFILIRTYDAFPLCKPNCTVLWLNIGVVFLRQLNAIYWPLRINVFITSTAVSFGIIRLMNYILTQLILRSHEQPN